MEEIKQEKLINKDMLIGDVVSKHPEVIETLMSLGVHCVGCGAAYMETIEQGFRAHGMSDEEITDAIKKLNEAANKEQEVDPDKPLTFSEKAIEKIKEMQEKQNKQGFGLRIEVVPGGCSGQSYSFEFVKEPTGEDKIIEVDEIKIIIDPQSFDMLKGSLVEYVETFQNAGFKIKNPNAESSCGCGQSFS